MVDGNIILSVAKAMELLQALSRAEKPLTLAELTEYSGYPKSTVFGLLTTMRAMMSSPRRRRASTPWACACLSTAARWSASGTSPAWPAPTWSICPSAPAHR